MCIELEAMAKYEAWVDVPRRATTSKVGLDEAAKNVVTDLIAAPAPDAEASVVAPDIIRTTCGLWE